MDSREKSLHIRRFEQKTQADSDLESMVPPLWSPSTYRVVAVMLIVLLIIGAGVIFWG